MIIGAIEAKADVHSLAAGLGHFVTLLSRSVDGLAPGLLLITILAANICGDLC